MTNCLEPMTPTEVRNAAEKWGVGGGMDSLAKKVSRSAVRGAKTAPNWRQRKISSNGGARMAPIWRQIGATERGRAGWRQNGARLAPNWRRGRPFLNRRHGKRPPGGNEHVVAWPARRIEDRNSVPGEDQIGHALVLKTAPRSHISAPDSPSFFSVEANDETNL